MKLRIERLFEIIWSHDQDGCLIIIIKNLLGPSNFTRFNQIVFKLEMNKQSIKGFLLASDFVPKGLSASAKRLFIPGVR